MRTAYWSIIHPVRKRLVNELPPKDLPAFLEQVAREACEYVERNNANGGVFHNFMRTPRGLHVVLSDEALHDRVLATVNNIGRIAWDCVVNHLIMVKLDRRL